MNPGSLAGMHSRGLYTGIFSIAECYSSGSLDGLFFRMGKVSTYRFLMIFFVFFFLGCFVDWLGLLIIDIGFVFL
jgi:hypothetical protein